MIETGVVAWRETAGDEYPECSLTNDEVVAAIYVAMRRSHPNRP